MEKSNLRKAIVAGQFYPANALELRKEITYYVGRDINKSEAIACMLPHAGYMYSGMVAATTIAHLNLKEKIILIGPNHTGYGSEFSIMAQGSWQTPLGNVAIDSKLADAILKNSRFLKDDELAHLHEHSLEVELPLLQYFREDFKILPITVFPGKLETLREIGREIAEVIRELKVRDSVLIVASSDMTHYEPKASAEEKDKAAIQAILELDEGKLFERVRKLNITMCGYAPVIIMLSAIKILGAKAAKLIKYQTSGDVTGDLSSVVGYAGIIFN